MSPRSEKPHHMILWYRPFHDRPREWKVPPSLMRVFVSLLVILLVVIVLATAFYSTLLRQVVLTNKLKADNNALRTEVARVQQLEAQMLELETFAAQLRKSLTEGTDLGRILAASRNVQKPSYNDVFQKRVAANNLNSDSSSTERMYFLVSGSSELFNYPQIWPLSGFVTRGFDVASIDLSNAHAGIDIAIPKGTPVKAVAEGWVVIADWTPRLGHQVVIDHGGGFQTVYAHNELLLVKANDRVKSGTPIALSGNSGLSTAPHLHFEVKKQGQLIDPLAVLPDRGRDEVRKYEK